MATVKTKTVWFCKECGNESSKWMGRCPACGEWNTMVEETISPGKNSPQIFLKLPKEQEKTETKQKAQKKRAVEDVKYPELFEILRQHRYQLAQKAHIPPYIIFSDKTLREMSTYLPVNREEMLAINGVGNSKYEKYGKAFENLIQDFIRNQNIKN